MHCFAGRTGGTAQRFNRMEVEKNNRKMCEKCYALCFSPSFVFLQFFGGCSPISVFFFQFFPLRALAAFMASSLRLAHALVLSLLAFVQKYKYWHLRSCAMPPPYCTSFAGRSRFRRCLEYSAFYFHSSSPCFRSPPPSTRLPKTCQRLDCARICGSG